MPKLSDLQASLLLEEIACAMRIGAPMDGAMRRLESRRLGAVGRTASRIAEEIEKGQSLSAALMKVDPHGQAAAAVAACEQSGDPGLIERISLQLRRRSEIRSESRIAWFYPFVLLLVGYLVAALILAPLIRRYSGEVIQWPHWVEAAAQWFETSWMVPLLIGAGIFLVVYFLLGRRNQYSKPIRWSLFCSALADQIVHDRPEQEAVEVAASFSGDRSLTSIASPSLLSPAVKQVVDGKGDWVDLVKDCDTASMVAALRYQALAYSESARRRDYVWSRLLPRTMMVVVGGGLILSYVWWVIAPVYKQAVAW